MADIIQFPRRNIRARDGITWRQLKALHFIKAYRLVSGGQWPSMEQLGREIGVRTLSGTKRIVHALIDAGAIERPRGRR